MRPFSAATGVLLSMCVISLCAGCSSVTTKHPLSENPEPIDQDKLEGTWLMDDEVVHVKFGSNGVAQVAGVEWEGNEFNIVRAEVTVTKGDKHNFLSVRVQEDGKWMDDYYLVSYMFAENGDLALWVPNVDAFRNLIVEKDLQGTVTKDKYSTSTQVSITSAPTSLLKLINGPENLKLFEYTEPSIIRKISEK